MEGEELEAPGTQGLIDLWTHGPENILLNISQEPPILIKQAGAFTFMRNYTRIRAWELADDVAVKLYALTRNFPRAELYRLTSQIRRAAYSVPANIAEGSARRTNKDYVHFLHMARASLTETHYFIHLSHRLGYLADTDRAYLEVDIRSTFACLNGLIKAVAKDSGT